MLVTFRRIATFATMLLALQLSGCGREPEQKEKGSDRGLQEKISAPAPDGQTPPPSPPLLETFDKDPVLSLFPRAGDYRPEEKDERLPYWATFIDHLIRISGIVQHPQTGNRAWSFRGINTIDSVGWFSPVAVQPGTSYTVSFKLKAELPEGGSAGIGLLEFDEFLWVNEQYSESLAKKHIRCAQPGLHLTGAPDFEPQTFTFTTGPDTRMIHLVLFREGTHSRDGVLFDDIVIKPAN